MSKKKLKRKKRVLSSDMAAYKMYLIEKITNQTPINWKELSGRADYEGLNTQKEALKNFINGRLKELRVPNQKENDQPTLAVETLLLNLKDRLSQVLTEDTANTIAKVFSVELVFSVFVRNEIEVEKYYRKFQKSTGSSRKDENKTTNAPLVYVFYYWKRNSIDYAILEITNYRKDRWEKGTLTYYHRNVNQTTNQIEYFPGPAQKIRSCDPDMNILFVHCIGNPIDNESGREIKIEGKELHTFLSIFVGGDSEARDWKILLATYSSVRRRAPIPACGVALMEMVNNKERAVQIITSNKVDDRILNFLYEKRFNTEIGTVLRSLNELPSHDAIENLKPIVGLYTGYHLDSAYEDNSDLGAFRTLLLHVFSSGKAVMRYSFRGELRELNGFFKLRGNELLHGTFINEVQTKEGYEIGFSRIHLVLEKALKKKKYLNGVYGGFRENADEPKAGLITFKKIDHATDFNDTNIDSVSFPKSFTKDDQIANEWVKNKLLSTNLIRFFRGDLGNYFDSLRKSVHPNIYEEENLIYEGRKKYDGPIGIFHLYSCSSEKHSIVKYPLKIDEWGNAEIKSAKKLVSGRAKFDASYLILDFNLAFGKENKGIYLIYIGSPDFSPLRIASGVSMRINHREKPQAKRELLLPKLVCSSSISEIDNNPGGEFKSHNFQDIYPGTEEFKKLNNITIDSHGRHYSIVESLLGREYNLIVTSAKVNEKNLLDREEFWKIYLISACYVYEDEERTIDNLYSKFGFDKSKLESELKGGTNCYRYFELSMEHGLFNFSEEQFGVELNSILERISHSEKIEKRFLSWYQDIKPLFFGDSKVN